MNSKHAEIILKLMRFLEAFEEIPVIHASFTDTIGGERINWKMEITFPIDAEKPKKSKEAQS